MVAWLPLLQAGSAIGSAVLGAKSANDAAAYNAAVDANNFSMQQGDRLLKQIMMMRQQRMAEAPVTNARGDVTEYIPGVGWQQRLSPVGASLSAASDREELARLTQDADQRRRGLMENERRRITEGGAADAALAEMNRPEVYDPQSLKSMIAARRVQDINTAYDETQRLGAMQALRSGTAGSQDAFARMAKERMQAISGVSDQAALDGLEAANTLKNSRRNNALNLYNVMASRASNVYDAPFNPSGVVDAGEANLRSMRNTVPQSAAMFSGMYDNTPQMQRRAGGYDNALAFGSIGDAAGGLFDYFSNNRSANSKSGKVTKLK